MKYSKFILKHIDLDSKIKNMYDLIFKVVLPQWKCYLHKKNTLAINEHEHTIPRKDALWKRVLRDIRDFYRILFRNRFSAYNFRSNEFKIQCVQIFMNELLMPLPADNKEYAFLFAFVHQTHRNQKLSRKFTRFDEINQNPFCAIDCYNNKTKKSLIVHPITSRMIYFVVRNFSELIGDQVSQAFYSDYIQIYRNINY